MVKPREDLLKKYWNLVDTLGYTPEEEDFYSEENLKEAIAQMEKTIEGIKKQDAE